MLLMAYQNTQLDSMLVSALGDDPLLVKELRAAFLLSAHEHLAALKAAPTLAQWHMAAWKFKGLCASFGVDEMAGIAAEATESERGDPALLRRLERQIAALSTAD